MLLFILVWKIKFIKPLQSINVEYLPVSTCCTYRGLLALVIVFHHLAQRTTYGFLFQQFTRVGYLAVAVFFFISGYGLQKSNMKSETYRKTFLTHRLPKILIPYIIITFLYLLVYYCEGIKYSISDAIVAIAKGAPIVPNSWYIVSILFFYIAFWILMHLCRKHYYIMVLCGGVWNIIYALLCKKFDFGAYWYNASHLFVVGMLWATCENVIMMVIRKIYSFTAIISGILLTFFFGCSFYVDSVIITIFIALIFTVCIVLFSMKCQIGNAILQFFGKISLEIYLIHGLFIDVLRSDTIYIKDDFLWCIFVLIFTIAFALGLNLLFKYIFEKYKMLLRRVNK